MNRPEVQAFRCPVELWPEVAATLLVWGEGKAWPREAVLMDLRWWTTTGIVPGVETLRARWGWERSDARVIVRGREWHDRSLPPPRRGMRRGAVSARDAALARFLRRAG